MDRQREVLLHRSCYKNFKLIPKKCRDRHCLENFEERVNKLDKERQSDVVVKLLDCGDLV